jgi:hypothetical protein
MLVAKQFFFDLICRVSLLEHKYQVIKIQNPKAR